MKIGFIGVGNMGRHMAANLIRAGHELTIFDIRPEARSDEILAGASWAATVAEVAVDAEVVVSSLPGPDQVKEVMFGGHGLSAALRPGTAYIDTSTVTPELARSIAAELAARGVESIDAPVSGGIRGARKGNLTIMVGATPNGFERALPVLSCMGEHVIRVGSSGAGHVAKLVNNMMGLVNGLAAMEAMVVGAKAGVEVDKLLEVIRLGAGDSFALNVIPFVVFKRGFDPAKFALSLATKDLRLGVEYAEELGVPVKVIRQGYEAIAEAERAGLGELDWSGYITTVEAAAGVEVRA
jgi:3-hydroxyisobutyrate dehydrogenase